MAAGLGRRENPEYFPSRLLGTQSDFVQAGIQMPPALLHYFWSSQVAALVFAAMCALCAAVATIDILLRKNDVRSALGWIAIVWLSPVLGGLAYYLFGINRVPRRALKFDRAPSLWDGDGASAQPPVPEHIAALAAIGSRITGDSLTGCNEISILVGGERAYPQMLADLAGARQNIALASYIFRSDAIGRQFIRALIAARQRGVQVRVLLDGVGSGYLWSPALQQLKAAQVTTARFLHTWIPWRMPLLNMRNHRKILIVDGTICFMGGMNIGAEYAAPRAATGLVQDIHFKVKGPVVRQIMDTFARDWTFTTDEILERALWWPKLEHTGNVCARAICSGPDDDLYKIEALLGAALAQARARVRIVTPYFLTDQRLQFAIGQAILRGVQIDILVPEHCDHTLLDWAMAAHMRFFQYAAPNFYFSQAPFDHAKLVTVDGEWCLIGSSNWDVRSFRLNFELDLECYGKEMTAQIDSLIDLKMLQARKFGAADKDRSMPVRLRDAAARLLLPYL
jgi:cardiolipin synthase